MPELTEPERAAVIQRAADHLGSQRALAEALGVSDMVISHWKKRGVPPEKVLEFETAVAGVVTRYELRPDIFGPPVGVAA